MVMRGMKFERSKLNQLLIVLTVLGIYSSIISAWSASIIVYSTNEFTNMSWDTSAKAYIDGAAGNPDVTIEVCGDTEAGENPADTYAKFVYRTGNITGFQNLASEPSHEYTQLTSCRWIGLTQCCKGAANFNFNSNWAVYPAYVYALVSDDTVFNESDRFIYIPEESHLKGYYTTNNVESTYNSATGNITLQITNVYSWTGSAYVANDVNLAYFQLGVCDPTGPFETYYWECSGGYSQASRNTAYSIYTGVVSPSDTVKSTKYYVINGMGTSFCIGPDPSVTSVSLNPSTQNAGGNVNVTITIRNDGNVDITQTFNVTVSVDGNDVQNLTVSGGLAKYTSTTRSFNLSTGSYTSGPHTVAARIAQTTIADCDTTNNQSQATLTLLPSYRVRLFINGTENNTFPDAGRPYNITINVSDTDGNQASNVIVRIYEVNGINLFAPVQKISSTPNRGLKPVAYGESLTNSSGITDFTIIPTGNKLYTDEYSYTNIDEYVGNYSLYIEVYNATTLQELQQTNGTDLIDRFEMTLQNMSARTPEPSERNTVYADHHDEYVQLMSEFMYNIFSTLSKWLVE